MKINCFGSLKVRDIGSQFTVMEQIRVVSTWAIKLGGSRNGGLQNLSLLQWSG